MRIILIILLAFILTSCTFGESKIKIFQVEEPRPELNLESPEPLTLEDLKWIIITSKNAEEVFARLEAQGFDPVLFGLTDKDYELKGSLIKCNPSIKEMSDQKALREALKTGKIDFVATDHAPHTIEEKKQTYFACVFCFFLQRLSYASKLFLSL